MGLTSGLHYPLKYDDDLKLLGLHGARGQLVEGAPAVDHVTDSERRHEEELVRPGSEAHVQLQLIQRQKLALRRLPRLNKACSGVRERQETASVTS